MEFEIERLKNQQMSLNNDNIIFREDINRLTEYNRHLEDELNLQRNRNFDLAKENDKLNKENLYLSKLVDTTNNKIAQIKFKENQMIENINQKMLSEERLKNLENELNKLRDIKNKNDYEHQRLIFCYNDLKDKNECDERQIILLQKAQDNKVTEIENKLTNMLLELENLKKENLNLRSENEDLRKNIEKVKIQKDNLKEKYTKEKVDNDVLLKEISDIKNQFEQYKNDLYEQEMRKLQEEQIRKNRIESKIKLVNELQKRIKNYRNSRPKKIIEENI
jgi:hypothetical protein